jgi:hypothetical protein
MVVFDLLETGPAQVIVILKQLDCDDLAGTVACFKADGFRADE